MIHVIWAAIVITFSISSFIFSYFIFKKKLSQLELREKHLSTKIKTLEGNAAIDKMIKKSLANVGRELSNTLEENNKWYEESKLALTQTQRSTYETLANNKYLLDAKLDQLLSNNREDSTNKTIRRSDEDESGER